jgi:Tol biopolymer transport system component/DNA-binding winged helix-turn-helix (wHTH) protein
MLLEYPTRVAFGLFEADFATGELWKAGLRIRLQSQPFRVLCVLVCKAGEVVTREELHSQVWGKETTVDFDRALAGAINKIREALGDSAENPRFVQTLAKRGYRFIAPVSELTSRLSVPDLSSFGAQASEDPHSPHAGKDMLATASHDLSREHDVLLGAGEHSETSKLVKARGHWKPLRILLVAGTALVSAGALVIGVTSRQPVAPVRLEQLTYNSPISPGPPNAETIPTLAMVGNRIITSVLVNGRPQLGTIDVGSGDVQQIALPRELASISLADVSQDGTRLLILGRVSSTSEQPLWIVPTSGGSAQRVANVLAHDATWMPDGHSILYANGNDLEVIDPSGNAPRRFAALSGRAFWLRWSPDGKMLRFTQTDPIGHTESLWEIRGSSAPIPLPGLNRALETACCGSWSPDGSAYIFQVARDHGTDLWEMKERFGPMLTQLTNGPIRYFSPVGARNGHRFFFLGSETPAGLQRFDATRHEFVPVQSFLANASRVTYSRDGHWVAWTDSDGALWRARASDGQEKLQLSPQGVEVFSAAWSPDGLALAIMARTPGQMWGVYLLDSAGGSLREAVKGPRNVADPSWSSDGRYLVFGGEPDLMGKENGPHEIQLLELNSHKVTTIPHSDGLFSPRWSPDGRWIAALTLDQNRVMLFDTALRTWTQLAVTSAADPVWSRDSKSIFVHAFQVDQQPVLRINVPTGQTQSVADLSDLKTRESANCFFGGLTLDNRPLILPRVGTSNLYTLDLDR